MQRNLPKAYYWFSKLNNTRFVPWSLDGEPHRYERLNELFRNEHNQDRQVESFGSRQDMDTFCGFEVVDGKVQDNIIVFNPSWQSGSSRNIILREHKDIFEFLRNQVLPEMKDWIQDDELDDYLEK